MRKSAVNPPKPMRPLYWTRIVTSAPPAPRPPSVANSTDSTENSGSSPDEPPAANGGEATPTAPPPTKEIWTEIEETPLDNIDEFTELFSRQAMAPVSKPKELKVKRAKSIKVLDPERSRNVGIIWRSLHVPSSEIEHAIYHIDTSVVSLEQLQHMSNIQKLIFKKNVLDFTKRKKRTIFPYFKCLSNQSHFFVKYTFLYI